MNAPKYKLKVVSLVCLVVSTTFLTQYFYYILSHKKYWMLETDMTLQQQKFTKNTKSHIQHPNGASKKSINIDKK